TGLGRACRTCGRRALAFTRRPAAAVRRTRGAVPARASGARGSFGCRRGVVDDAPALLGADEDEGKDARGGWTAGLAVGEDVAAEHERVLPTERRHLEVLEAERVLRAAGAPVAPEIAVADGRDAAGDAGPPDEGGAGRVEVVIQEAIEVPRVPGFCGRVEHGADLAGGISAGTIGALRGTAGAGGEEEQEERCPACSTQSAPCSSRCSWSTPGGRRCPGRS